MKIKEKKSKKKVSETEMDVAFQDNTSPSVQQTTKRVNASNPADALRQATMGMQTPQGPVMISPAQGGVPGQQPLQQPGNGAPALPQQPIPGQPGMKFPMEGIAFPQRIMLPNSFVAIIDEIVEKIDGAKMITVSGRPGVVLVNEKDYRSAFRILEKSKHPSARIVLEGLVKAKTR